MAFDVERVREIAERVAASSGLEVVEVEFRGGGKARMLRVFIDKPRRDGSAGRVTHEDCANSAASWARSSMSRMWCRRSYSLEVSSPGLDRKLIEGRGFRALHRQPVKLTTRQPVDGNRHFEGRLESFQNGRLTLDLSVASHKSRKKMSAVAGAKIEIDLANVEKANLVPEI